LKGISLFSGCGAMDLGMEQAGIDIALHCENDLYAGAVLRRHWPTVKNIGDIEDARPEGSLRSDIIFGGFPCQDVSISGCRRGLDGRRSCLWYEFLLFVESIRPRWVVVENVPGLLSSNAGRDFATILGGLDELGYCVVWRVFDAQYFRVAQRRRRVFIVGSHQSGCAATVLFEREGLRRDPATGKGQRKAIAPGSGEYIARPGRYWNGQDIANALDSSMLSKGQMMPDGNRMPVIFDNHSHDGRLVDAGGLSPTLNQQMGTGGNNVPLVADPLVCKEGETYTHEGTNFRLRNVMPGLRRLMPVECERLQGLPNGWTEFGIDVDLSRIAISDTQRYKMLGNAVPVPVARWIGMRIVEAERKYHAC
jgi:DNA (cytosine-5)-methyltransferase 1